MSVKKEIRKILVKHCDNRLANDMIELEVFDLMVHYSADLEIKIDAYKECFEQFIPIDKWDEATYFLSSYKDGLAQSFQKKEDKINHKKS